MPKIVCTTPNVEFRGGSMIGVVDAMKASKYMTLVSVSVWTFPSETDVKHSLLSFCDPRVGVLHFLKPTGLFFVIGGKC